MDIISDSADDINSSQHLGEDKGIPARNKWRTTQKQTKSL